MDFSRLDNRTFERLVQSVASVILGPGVVTWGDGPDGGREGTANGVLPYPFPPSEVWDGYTVLQAKCKARIQDSTQDGAWALAQLREELDDWFGTDAKRKPLPDYFLFATNVHLTPSANGGSLDACRAVLEELVAAGRLKGFAIWDAYQLTTFLNGQAAGVRRNFVAWLTPSDVLAEILEVGQAREDAFRRAIVAAMARDLTSDEFAGLTQGGHGPEAQARLDQVFIDLPLADAEYAHSDGGSYSSLAYFLKIGDSKGSDHETTSGVGLRRHVLIGGPGQGKSTIGQLLCQAYRAAFLDGQQLSPEVDEARQRFLRGWEEGGLPLPRGRRWPIRIVLSRFADSLAEGRCNSVIDYIAQHISHRAPTAVPVERVTEWLGQYPWLLVLDGLDEVPASSNRAQMLQSISDFWQDASAVSADVVVLATTRPQGYNDEFSPRYYTHHQLAPLPLSSALIYADRLAAALWGETDRADELGKRLRAASAETSTRRLLETPLQVTIMCFLVDRLGEPPRERYELFSEYYRVIYQRELEKGGPHSTVLRTHRADVDFLHFFVGFTLQLRSERAGGSDAKLSIEDFRRVVAWRLSEEGHEGDQFETLTQALMDAAVDRLVFLVAPQEGFVGFEIRSLQEYMAAEALSEGTDEQVRYRLELIAGQQHWRNVFLFMAGRIFSRAQPRRDSLQALLNELDTQQLGSAGSSDLTATGAQLAVALLGERVAATAPRHRRALADRAVRIFDVPVPAAARPLANNIDEADLDTFWSACLAASRSEDAGRLEAAWGALAARADLGDEQAFDRLAAMLSCELSDTVIVRLLEAIDRFRSPALTSAAATHLLNRGWWNYLAERVTFHREAPAASLCVNQPPPIFGVLDSWRDRGRLRTIARRANIHFMQASCGSGQWFAKSVKDSGVPAEWSDLTALADFMGEPSAASLAAVLRTTPPSAPFTALTQRMDFPWVLQLALQRARSVGSVRVVDEIMAGDFADSESWLAVEDSLRRREIDGSLLQPIASLEPRFKVDIRLIETGVLHDANYFQVSDDAREVMRSLFDAWLETGRHPEAGKRILAALAHRASGLDAEQVLALQSAVRNSDPQTWYFNRWISADMLMETDWQPAVFEGCRLSGVVAIQEPERFVRATSEAWRAAPSVGDFAAVLLQAVAFLEGEELELDLPGGLRDGDGDEFLCSLLSPAEVGETDLIKLAKIVRAEIDEDGHAFKAISALPRQRRIDVLVWLLRQTEPAAELRQILISMLDRAQNLPLGPVATRDYWAASGVPQLALALATDA